MTADIMSNSTTNETMLALCPPFTEAENAMVANTAFYIDGVAKTTVAGNIIQGSIAKVCSRTGKVLE